MYRLGSPSRTAASFAERSLWQIVLPANGIHVSDSPIGVVKLDVSIRCNSADMIERDVEF